ncbi:hypothetical protein HanPI659440_Chr10g0381871 [Helianthus annuus]|nr:hypothetical protein HanPI659440_Chr10g0381871 [Helianthus annuus]
MPKLLNRNGQKGWPYFQRLLVDLFQFMVSGGWWVEVKGWLWWWVRCGGDGIRRHFRCCSGSC